MAGTITPVEIQQRLDVFEQGRYRRLLHRAAELQLVAERDIHAAGYAVRSPLRRGYVDLMTTEGCTCEEYEVRGNCPHAAYIRECHGRFSHRPHPSRVGKRSSKTAQRTGTRNTRRGAASSDPQICQYCGGRCQRRPGETSSNFRRRKSCSAACSTALKIRGRTLPAPPPKTCSVCGEALGPTVYPAGRKESRGEFAQRKVRSEVCRNALLGGTQPMKTRRAQRVIRAVPDYGQPDRCIVWEPRSRGFCDYVSASGCPCGQFAAVGTCPHHKVALETLGIARMDRRAA